MNTDYYAERVSVRNEEPPLLSPRPGTYDEPLTSWRDAFANSTFRIGLVLLAVSAGLFAWHDQLMKRVEVSDTPFGWFFAHYGIAILYSVMVASKGGFTYLFRNDRRQQATSWVLLVLWWLSAFALNRSLSVFDESVPWLCWLLVGSSGLLVLHTWADRFPAWGQQLLYAGLTGTWLLTLYQSIYLGALYPISVPALIGLGLSVHTFIPALMTFMVGRQLWLGARQRTYLRRAVLAGLAVPVTLLLVFLVNWGQTVQRLNRVRREAVVQPVNDLPVWVQMAQHLHPGPFTDRVLRVGMVYGTSPWGRSFSGLTALSDRRLHDPLVVIAENLIAAPDFEKEDQKRLLRTVSQQHYGTEEKLWRGGQLATPQLATQVRIWPQYRLSYTEKTLWVRNQQPKEWRSQEALYTFHLPEGSAVSALSLWINGREEPARLTTPGKAGGAYKQIVGVEQRDPSVLTWQEGNRVTVRVFPVRAGEARQVKIGITSPLRLDGNGLVYENPWFEGPDASHADETLKLTFDTDPAVLEMNGLSGSVRHGQLQQEARYQPDWSVRFIAPPLSPLPFQLDGKAYQMRQYVPRLSAFQPTDLYFDVNAGWTEAEFDSLCQWADGQPGVRSWVTKNGLTQLTSDNRAQLFDELTEQAFSLFPLHRVEHTETALLITKGTPTGPTLSDLDGTPLANGLTRKATTLTAPMRTYNLGNALPPYLKTLTELRVLHTTTGDLTQLQRWLKQHRFATDDLTPDRVTLNQSGLVIQRFTTDSAGLPAPTGPMQASLAPDHLLRLFCYNQLMARVGRHYFDQTYRNDGTLTGEAQIGHVVSPVSSLVVLETQDDYTRFGINADKKGLDNATLNQDGAVPEPHEWAMLVIIALLISWFYVRPKLVVVQDS